MSGLFYEEDCHGTESKQAGRHIVSGPDAAETGCRRYQQPAEIHRRGDQPERIRRGGKADQGDAHPVQGGDSEGV